MKHSCKKKILSKTPNGKIIKCSSCDKYHVEFSNLLFTFNKEEFLHFKDYFLNFDASYWEGMNTNLIYSRKITIPVGHKNITTLFNKLEIEELKQLFSPQKMRSNDNASINFSVFKDDICYN